MRYWDSNQQTGGIALCRLIGTSVTNDVTSIWGENRMDGEVPTQSRPTVQTITYTKRRQGRDVF